MEESTDTRKLTLIEHLTELRTRLIYSLLALFGAFGICYYFSKNIYQFLVAPLLAAGGKNLIFTGLTEAFFTYVKVAFFAGFVLAFPFIAFQLYRFLAPGLYKKEKKILLPFLIGSPILFFAGIAMAYYFIFPVAWKFFLSFETPNGTMPIVLQARVSEYLSLVLHLMFAFGLAFQMPVILALLCHGGFISAAQLRDKRRYAILLIFVIAGIITPPDVISMVGLAIPMLLLYEGSILICRKIEKTKNA